MTVKTVRLIDAQWQGGMNRNYSFGARLLSEIIPPSCISTTETIEVPVSNKASVGTNVDAEETLLNQMKTAYDILITKDPDHVITVGGDCAVSQAPFDYLHHKYPNDLGLIWLDAHPDVANEGNSHHVHEMVLANLLHQGSEKFNKLVKNPFKPENVLLAGLKYQDLRPMDDAVNSLNLKFLVPNDLVNNFQLTNDWILERKIKHIVIHWDLDVLTPDDFHSILPAEPGLNLNDFGAAIGELRLDQVFKFLNHISQITDLVGLTIAEHMPWDALRMREGLKELPIFN